MVAIVVLAASVASASLKPCRFAIDSDRDREGLVGPVQTVVWLREPADGPGRRGQPHDDT